MNNFAASTSTSLNVGTLFERFQDYCSTNDYKMALLKEPKLMKQLVDFLDHFPVDYLPSMPIEQYVTGAQNKNSFCYIVEDKLRDLGAMAGRSTAYQKFVVYWDKYHHCYSFGDKRIKQRKNFGSTVDEAYDNVKANLGKVVSASLNNDMKALAENPLNPLFKNKVAYLYNHEREIPIYSDNDLNIILSAVGVPFDKNVDRTYKRKALFDFYVDTGMNQKATPFIFMQFLYNPCGYRSLLRDPENQEHVANSILVKDVGYGSAVVAKSGHGNHAAVVEGGSEETKRLVGRRGEDIVIQYLKTHAKELGIHELKAWCNDIAIRDDSKGYDISYRNDNGKETYIEVKSTKQDYGDQIHFEISANELAFLRSHQDSYEIYFINDINHQAVIKRIKASEIRGEKPLDFLVEFKGKDIC